MTIAEDAANRYLQYAVESRAKADQFAAEKRAAEKERDELRHSLDQARQARDQWREMYFAAEAKTERVRRHREILLDSMVSAEDRGADFSGIQHRTWKITDEVAE